jgi:hypothetical protein
MKIRCTTLYDITKTNVTTRRQLLETQIYPEKQRNQQRNLETILQIISLRTQPENISEPRERAMTVEWESSFKDTIQNTWTFTFDVDKESIFDNGRSNLGNLYDDCAGVPMIIGLNETCKLSEVLCLNNIYFEIEL